MVLGVLEVLEACSSLSVDIHLCEVYLVLEAAVALVVALELEKKRTHCKRKKYTNCAMRHTEVYTA